MRDFVIENLPGELPRLLQHDAAVFGVGVMAEIGGIVDEALAARIDHDAERIRVLLELVADREIAELRRIAIPADRVAARPIAARLCADLERHADAIAGVEPRSAYFCQIPVGSEIARAPFRIGLEPPAREDDRLGAQFTRLALLPHAHAANTAIVREQRNRAGLVEHLNALARRRLVQRLDEPRPAARGLDGEPAPELELAADLERLPTVDRHETHALTTQPLQ